ncbi:unnamed protein product [Urochloa humidicola]
MAHGWARRCVASAAAWTSDSFEYGSARSRMATGCPVLLAYGTRVLQAIRMRASACCLRCLQVVRQNVQHLAQQASHSYSMPFISGLKLVRTESLAIMEVIVFQSYSQLYATYQLTADVIFHLPDGMPYALRLKLKELQYIFGGLHLISKRATTWPASAAGTVAPKLISITDLIPVK